MSFKDMILVLVFTGYLILSNIVRGELLLDAPRKVSAKGDVEVSCIYQPSSGSGRTPPVSVSSCSLSWTRIRHVGRHSVIEALQNDNDHIQIITAWHSNHKRPLVSKVFIRSLQKNDEGTYKCTFHCKQNEVESATVKLEFNDNSGTDSVTVIFLTVAAIIVATLALFVIAIECIKRRSPGNDMFACQDDDIETSSTSSSSMNSIYEDSQKGLPPRYSLVVISTQDLSGAERTFNKLLIDTDTSKFHSALLVPTPPPEYSKALFDLAQRGIFYDSSQLKPAPPAYSDSWRQQTCSIEV